MNIDQEQIKRPDLWLAFARLKDRQGQHDVAVQYLQEGLKYAPGDASLTKELEIQQKKIAATMPATTRAAP
jgi:hypothetical protein